MKSIVRSRSMSMRLTRDRPGFSPGFMVSSLAPQLRPHGNAPVEQLRSGWWSARHDANRCKRVNWFAALVERSPFHLHDTMGLVFRGLELNDLAFQVKDIAGANRCEPA